MKHHFIDRAVMMMSIAGFFHEEFSDMPVIETSSQTVPKALIGLLKVIGRARRAAEA